MSPQSFNKGATWYQNIVLTFIAGVMTFGFNVTYKTLARMEADHQQLQAHEQMLKDHDKQLVKHENMIEEAQNLLVDHSLKIQFLQDYTRRP